ncbi:p-loop containing nucleoside triphosphate hydrolase [Fusarium longipes]|uniref:p-loop containing nucleoside triphosphate hydrolase n=1 Tax=Fusarium longipes TaxID=694270 RepID=A0A395SZN8_9HYPO|nr:p-loop containing nucleoside triphosphate hydrolase [Fusarium longipes]
MRTILFFRYRYRQLESYLTDVTTSSSHKGGVDEVVSDWYDMTGRGDTSTTDSSQMDADEPADTSNVPNGTKDTLKVEETAQDGKEAIKVPDVPKLHWATNTSLWCSLTGRSHADLWEFGLDECPRCEQSLERPPHPEAPTVPLPLGIATRAGKKSTTKGSSKAILHAVEYRDNGNITIGSEPWEGEFDLDSLGLADTPAFEIVHVLLTSIQANMNRQDWEAERLIESGILKKPNMRAKIISKRLTVHSPSLLNIIRNYVRYYPSATANSSSLWLEEPFALVAHHYKELQGHWDANKTKVVQETTGTDIEGITVDEDEEVTGLRHLGWLLDFFKKAVLDEMTKEQDRHARDMCTFRMLWLLFKPGMTVYHESGGHLGAYVLQSVDTDPGILSIVAPMQPKPYKIKVWSLDFDGKYVGRVGKSITIAPFEGERPIRSLQLVPCRAFDRDDNGTWRTELEERGKRWYQLLPGGQVHYSGPVLETKRQLDGRVYIDHASYTVYSSGKPPVELPPTFDQDTDSSSTDDERTDRIRRRLAPRLGPKPKYVRDMGGKGLSKCQCEDCRGLRPHPPHGFPWVDYDILDPAVDKDLTKPGATEGPKHRYLLCGRLLKGFDLKTRTWVQLDVAYCKPPRPNIRAIDTLVMPSERKDMIKALIQKFTSNDLDKTRQQAWRADYIENKGDGRIFLLHGSPGVGKTYTAECIAEYTERPLLSLTCGDIGTDEVKMETQLSKWFQLAEKWGAVMLIDEADVYLERRQVTDLKRNSLVAVFLRCIEYYRGILFLTTNRVGQFDDAFISRIHVIIHYEKLTSEGQKKVWMQFFDKLDYDREDIKVTRRAKDYILEDEAITEMDWNGREIRNAFQTAVALADYRFQQGSSNQKQPTLDQRDFEQVCEMMKQFKSYLVNVHNMDEGQRAFNAGSRALTEF